MYNMCIIELFGSIIDFFSFLFVLSEFLCCLCGIGFEEYVFVRVLKVFIGIEFIEEEKYVNV